MFRVSFEKSKVSNKSKPVTLYGKGSYLRKLYKLISLIAQHIRRADITARHHYYGFAFFFTGVTLINNGKSFDVISRYPAKVWTIEMSFFYTI